MTSESVLLVNIQKIFELLPHCLTLFGLKLNNYKFPLRTVTMAVHPIDSTLYGWKFGTAESRSIWSDSSVLQAWLAVEATFALSQAELGMIPKRQPRRLKNV